MGYTKQAAVGVGWMGGLKLVIRAITFVRLFIIARILLPDDFGLFGIAALVLAFLEIFTETGINVFFVQSNDKNVLKKYVDTAWIVSILRGFLMFGLIFVLADPISAFFNTPEAKSLIVLISIVPLIKGFINPSVIKFQKGLEFAKEFCLRSLLVLIDSSVTIGFALYFKSAESLVAGIIAAAVIEAMFSLSFIKPAPKFNFNFKKFGEIISKGKWVTLNGIMGYLTSQGDDAVVAKLLNSAQLGFYQIAYRFAILPGTEISDAINRVAFPTFSKISKDRKRLKKAYLKIFALTFVLSVPLGLILMIFPKEIIMITVGENWLPATDALRILSLFGMVGALAGTRNSVLYSIGRQDIAGKISFIKLLVLAVLIIPFVDRMGIIGAAYASLFAVLAIVPPTVYYLAKVLNEKR